MDWILSICSCIMLWMMGDKNKYAPLVGIAVQILWIYYAISLGQFGLILGTLMYTAIHARNAYKWLKGV